MPPLKRKLLILFLAIGLVRGLIYTSVIPPWGTPDEPRHMEYVQILYRKRRLVKWGDSTPEIEQAIIRSMDRYSFWRWGQSDFDPPYPGALPERFHQIWPGGLAHQLHQPPLGYLLYALLLPITSGWDLAMQLYVMRLLSVLLGVLVVLVGFLTANELFPDNDILAVGIPAFIVFLPMHTFLLSGLNNDHLAEFGTSVVVFILVLTFKQGISLPKVFGIVLALIIALLAKRTALVMVPTLIVAGVVYLRNRWNDRKKLKWQWIGTRLGGGVIILLTGFLSLEYLVQHFPEAEGWLQFIRNVYLFLPSSQFRFSFEQPYLSPLAVRLYGHYLNTMFESFWARFGWMNIRPGAAWYAAFGFLSLASLLGWVRFLVRAGKETPQLRHWQREVLLVFVFGVIFMLAIVIGREIRGWDLRWGGWPQGRFLFPVIIPIATLFVLGWYTLLPEQYRCVGIASLIGFLIIADAFFLVNHIIPFFYSTPSVIASGMSQADGEGSTIYLPLVLLNREEPQATVTPTASVTPSPTPTVQTMTPTSSTTRQPTVSVSPTATPTPMQAHTFTPTVTVTATRTESPTPTGTQPHTSTPPQTRTPTSTKTQTPTRTPTATPTTPVDGRPNPFGVTMLGAINDPQARALARAAGIRWVRTSISWSSVEPENLDLTNPNNGNWPDRLLQDLEADGLSPVLLIWQNPSWVAPTDCGPLYDGMLPEFGQFVRALAERYDGDGDYNGDGTVDGPPLPNVHYYEFYNEPDLNPNRTPLRFGGCWGDQGAAYAALLREAYENVKAANPLAQIMTGGLAYDSHYNRPDAPPPPACYVEDTNFFNYYFLDEVLSTSFEDGTRGGDYVDIINFHYHRGSSGCWAPWGPETLGKAKYLESKLASLGFSGKVIAVTEDGEKRYDPRPGREDDYSDEGQARYVVMSFVRALAGRFAVLTWFTFEHFVDNLGREWGLLDPNGNPRPAYEAYQVLTRRLEGALFVGNINVPGIEGYEFDVSGGVRQSVLWTSSGTKDVSFAGQRFEVANKYGVTSIIVDGGAGDQDGTVNGQVVIRITNDPVYVQRAP